MIFMPKFGHANTHINDGFIDQEFRPTYRTAIQVLDGRWTKGLIEVFSNRRYFFLTTHIVPC
jgi:hypothetical protein